MKKWQSSVNNGKSWTDIPKTTLTYTSGALSQTTWFRAVIKSGLCSEANSGYATITVNPLPSISISASPGFNVDYGTNLSLTASGASRYVWSPGGSTLNPLPVGTPSAPITYTVTGTDANGCSSTQSANIYM